MSIVNFLTASPRLLCFGFAMAFFSSFGQTYFISLSGAEIRDTFGLSHGDFGLIYAVGTLSSATLIIWVGQKIDSIDLRLYSAIVCGGLALACFGMSIVSSALWLCLVIFGLRFTGQGLMTHISTVSMARYFGAHRGKALSIAGVGYPAGEALYPTLAVMVIALIGWRDMWLGISVILAVGLIPLALWLLKGHSNRHQQLIDDTTRAETEHGTPAGLKRGEVLRDKRFYIVLPSYLAPSFISTGYFFHQVHLVEFKGWDLTWFASTFVVFAIGQTIASLVTGVLVDKYGALRLIRACLLPLILGSLFLASSDAPYIAVVFMLFAGMGSGTASVVQAAFWPEAFGVKHLGAIKALGMSLMVFASAMSPPIMGLAIDAGITMDTIALACAFYAFMATLIVIIFYPANKG